MPDPVVITARAPVRVDLAGGWTDVAHFAEAEGGAVVNVAVAHYVHVEAALGRRRTILLAAEDLDVHRTITSPADLTYDGTLDLHKAALNMLPVTGGLELVSRADVPPGSGLGASGALDVALLAALARAREEDYDAVELAEMGYLLETGELGLEGGRQDQYAAALGGCHAYRFGAEPVGVEPIPLDDALADALGAALVIAFTGESHFSSATHRRVWQAWADGAPEVVDALRALRDLAREVAPTVRAGDWTTLGRLVNENWRHQQRLDATISTPGMRVIEEAMRSAGALGLKATGAGAGGCLVAIADPDRAATVADAAARAGARVLAGTLDRGGVQVAVEVVDAGRPGA